MSERQSALLGVLMFHDRTIMEYAYRILRYEPNRRRLCIRTRIIAHEQAVRSICRCYPDANVFRRLQQPVRETESVDTYCTFESRSPTDCLNTSE